MSYQLLFQFHCLGRKAGGNILNWVMQICSCDAYMYLFLHPPALMVINHWNSCVIYVSNNPSDTDPSEM